MDVKQWIAALFAVLLLLSFAGNEAKKQPNPDQTAGEAIIEIANVAANIGLALFLIYIAATVK